MKADILLGLQWGDEGKGKIVDVLTPDYDVIARFQGGPNAGHSLQFMNQKHILHTIPSGIFHPEKLNIIGNGVVIDPVIFEMEINHLKEYGIDPLKNLVISQKAQLILPTHRVLDAAAEAAKGEHKIGSTLKGIGPTYMDKTGRNGLRTGALIHDDFRKKYDTLKEKHLNLLKLYDFEGNFDAYEEEWFRAVETLKSFPLIESEYMVNENLDQNRSVLAEGAQGTMLDIDFGTYPFVTSSNTISAGACTGLGIAPNRIGKVIGIFKAYCTRVGSGPFPTELHDATGEKLQFQGNEFGATTGRPRRCGWLDLPALCYAIMLNGVTELVITKSDVLTGFSSIQVCTHYEKQGRKSTHIPPDMEESYIPVFKTFKGWDVEISDIREYAALPETLKSYITFIETETGIPVKVISVGPEREAVIQRS